MEKWEKELDLLNQLADAFDDTQKMCVSEEFLVHSIRESLESQEIILENEEIDAIMTESKDGRVIVSRKKTLTAASAYKQKGKKIAVLNFASALCPGGGGKKIRQTQEECLCRETTLYSCINTDECKERFYGPHKALNSAYNADMIYTPDVVVFKTDTKVPEVLRVQDWFYVDVITMAAPNIRKNEFGLVLSDDELLSIFTERFNRMMQKAICEDVDVLILGAFGCGTFGNDPAIVATAAARALEVYRNNFDTVEFAVYEGRKKSNFRMFRLILDKYCNDDAMKGDEE